MDEQGTVVAVAVLAIDRTERKRAEEELQKAHDELERRVEERTAELTKANEELAIFRRFAEASGEGLGMSDFDGRIVYANPSLCRLYGEKKPENVIGKNVSTYYAQEYVQRRKDELIPALLRDGHWHIEQPVLPRHGKPIQTLQSTFLIRDEGGNPFRIAVVISDITERKRAEEALRASEERLRLAQQVARVGTFELDLRTGLNTWTPELEAMYGLSPGGFPRTEAAWESLVYCDDRAEAIRLREHTLETGEPVEGEWRVMWQDGSVHWLAGRWKAIKDESGKPLRLTGVNIDITERKRAEKAIKESEEKLRALFQILPVGISILDENCHVVELNPALGQILGMTEEGLLRGDYSRRQCLRSDCSPMPPEEYPSALAMKTGTVVSNVEVGVVKEDGKTVWTSVSAAPLPVRGLGVAVATMDITERQQDQEALQREHRTLKHLLESSDHERQTIAYEIHDGLAQYLAGAIMQFDAFDNLKETKPKQAATPTTQQ